MRISSRTPEGEPNTCGVCGKGFVLEPSDPAGDAPCPHCGSLTWFASTIRVPELREVARERSGVDRAPAFRFIRPTEVSVFLVTEPISRSARRAYRLGKLLWPIVRPWSRRRRLRDRDRLTALMLRCSRCWERLPLERLIGPPIRILRHGGEQDEYHETARGDVVLRFVDGRLEVIFGTIPFSPLEWGAGIAPEQRWRQLTAKSSALISVLDRVTVTPP